MSKEFNNQEQEATYPSRDRATIGPSISIKGEVTGSEDLLIEGNIEGAVDLKDNCVTVGKGAKVNASISGNVIRVEGTVTGDLYGAEQVVVTSTGCVRGNIASPRLVLEDGARLKGSIDTEPSSPNASMSVEKIRNTATTDEQSSAYARPADAKRNGVHTLRNPTL